MIFSSSKGPNFDFSHQASPSIINCPSQENSFGNKINKSSTGFVHGPLKNSFSPPVLMVQYQPPLNC